MSDVFLSWSSADERNALSLYDRLTDLGLVVWEYKNKGLPGAQIRDEIIRKISTADIAVIGFSDATADAEWLRDEVAWCWQSYKTRLRPSIIPVWIGPHPEEKMPTLLRDENIRAWDLTSGGDAEFTRLADSIFNSLGRNAPDLVPAALFTMTRPQCEQLLAQVPNAWVVAELCSQAGMESPPALFESLLSRYGDTVEKFAPYDPDRPLIEIIQSEARRANEWRRANTKTKRPIALRWIHNDLADEKARELWESHDSLLVIDSVSMFHPDVKDAVKELPNTTRTSALWVPPYTQKAASVEQCLQAAARSISRVGDLFKKWDTDPLRHITFDPQTRLGLRQWLRRALADIGVAERPDERAIESMETLRDVAMDRASFFREAVGK
jgi:hypothetical protein